MITASVGFLISIHVPSWGTTLLSFNLKPIGIFQSTFPRGERLCQECIRTGRENFNPRSLVGNDDLQKVIDDCPLKFQSTFPRGERQLTDYPEAFYSKFQSTFPRGERPFHMYFPDPFRDFNPRSLVGNDDLLSVLPKIPESFQSTFPRGERLHASVHLLIFHHDFNPRSLVGNDGSGTSGMSSDSYFNPRSLVGNDCIMEEIRGFKGISIHVPSWGTTCSLAL